VRAPSKRSLWDATITEVLAGYYEPDEHGRRKPESLYGSLKMWAHLQREGVPVAKSTVERLMRRHGWQGVRRQKSVRTTIADPAAVRPPDLVDRQFGVGAPNRLLVADFTYVKLITGVFVYVAFVIDACAGSIVGWEASASKQTRFVESAIRQAAALRSRQGRPIDGAIHHSDAGSQGGFNWSTQHLDFSEVCDGVREAVVRGSWLSGSGSLAGPADGGLAPGQGQVLGGHCCGGDDRGRCRRSGRVVAGWVSVVPPCWRRESTIARDRFGSLPVLG
jgi:putative transposase